MNSRDAKKIETMVADIRATENMLLQRSRENLKVLTQLLSSPDESKRVPAVLTTFSIAGIIAGLFINAGINHGRLLAYHIETLTIYLNQLAEHPKEELQALATLRHEDAGLHFPWIDNRVAEIQTWLERFQEIQVRGISPHLSFINKITEVTRALSESPEGIAAALRTYASDKTEQVFVWTVVEELVECIDDYAENLEAVRSAQLSTEDKMTAFMAETNGFLDTGKQPDSAVVGAVTENATNKLCASFAGHADQLNGSRTSLLRFDKSLQLMAKTLPPFIRTLSNLTAAWNKEASV